VATEPAADSKWAGVEIPLHDFIGLTIDPGPPAVVEAPLTPAVQGAFRALHGGIFATLADVACATVVAQASDAAQVTPVTTDLNVRYYSQPRSGPVRAEAVIVHQGRQVISAEAVITDGGGYQLARVTATFMLVPSKPFSGEVATAEPPG